MARAIAYIRDIVLSRTGEVIARARQTELIKQFAADNGIEIAAWFEDETGSEDVLARPGIQALLAYPEKYNMVICDRVWTFSHSMAALEPFFKELDRRNVGFESATSAWDRVSQQCRRRFSSAPILPRANQLPEKNSDRVRYRVAKPVRLNFVYLVHPAPPSVSQRL